MIKPSSDLITNFKFWWIISLIIKLILVSFTPLTSDEHYYWVWSQNLRLSYFDHPPMVAWLFTLGNFLPSLFLKWPAITFGHFFFLIWDKFLNDIGFTNKQRLIFFALCLFSPLIGMSGLAITPDLPVLVFMGLLVYSFHKALKTQKLIWYLLFGLSLGLGFTSKYHIVLLLPGMLAYLIITKQLFRVNFFYLIISLIPFGIGSSPVFIWNYLNDWASFRFQLNHGLGDSRINLKWETEFLLSQIFILTPFLIHNFFTKNENKDKKINLYFIYSFVPILLLFSYSALKNKVEANWTQAAYPFIFSYLAQKKIRPLQIKFYCLFWGILLTVLIFQWNLRWIPNPKSEKLIEPFRYEALLSEQINFQPFYVSSYQMASYLWFETKKPVYKLKDMSRVDLFDTFEESIPTHFPIYLAKFNYTYPPEWFKSKGLNWVLVKKLDYDLEIVKVDHITNTKP